MSLDLDLIYSQFNFKVDKSDKNKIYEFEEFRLDAVHLMLYQKYEEIPLAPKAVETLLALVEKRGEILSKNDLMETIWTDSIVEESNLAQYLHILRKTLGKTKDGKPFIETFRRRGYRFNGEVSVGDFLAEAKPKNTNQNFTPIHAPTNGKAIREATSGKVVALADWRHDAEEVEKLPEAISPPAQVTKFPVAKRKTFPLIGAIVFGLLMLTVGFFAFTRFRSDTPTADAPITTIAVLPFENASGDANLDYLSDGLSESLIDRLAQLSQLKVIARSSSFKYRGQNIDLQDAAAKLGVQAIVTGRVAQRGDSLIIRVEMIDTRDNRQLWSDNFTRKLSDAQKLQTDISREITENLHLRLSGAQTRQLAKQETTNPQAYELLLKGRFYALKIGKEDQKKGIEYYEQAIAVDPDYALAYAKLSDAYAIFGGNPKEFIPKAQAAARKALELDENLADAHLAMARLYQMAWDWAAAEAAYKRTIELNPNLADARRIYAFYLGVVGRHDESIIEVKRARELDPMSLINSLSVANAFLFARRFDEAIAETEKLLELNENYRGAYYTLGFSYAAKGMYGEAIANYQEAMRRGGNSISGQIYLGAAYARSGEREKALDILKQLETSKEYVSPCELTVLYVALGEREKAFASFEKAYAARDSQLQFLKVDPAFDSLRDDARFQDLQRRVGLPQ